MPPPAAPAAGPPTWPPSAPPSSRPSKKPATCTSQKGAATIPPPPKPPASTASIRTETDIHGTRRSPAYYVAVFTAVRTQDQSGYSETAARMEDLVKDVPG